MLRRYIPYRYRSMTPVSTKFRNHCKKSDKCQKLSRERAHGRAGSDTGSGAVAQNLNLPNSSGDQCSNGIAGSSNMQNGGYTSQQPGPGNQQPLASPTRQENNLQDQSAIDPPVRPDSNGSNSTLQGRSKSLGGSHPFGEVQCEQDRESQRGGFMNTLKKGTFGRRAGRDVNNQNNQDDNGPEATFWRRMMSRSGNTS